jgi:glycine/D-amino acid oxidase-like deaminating enzyme
MERAVDYVDKLIREYNLQSEYWFPGFLRVATTPGFERRIRHDIELLASMGATGIEWIEKDAVQSLVASPRFLGAMWEPRCGLLDPAKQVRELKRVALELGAQVFEHSPVSQIDRGAAFRLLTPKGVVQADKIVLATNAYSHLIPSLRAKQVPAFTHMVITEPLTPQQQAAVRWEARQGIEDARNLVHYFRLTADGRLAMGGSDVSIAYRSQMERDLNPRIFRDLERDIEWLFPQLKGIAITHRWGGPVSVPVDLAPAIGRLGDSRALFSLGCVGHGVSMSHLNGKTLTDLVLERKTDLTDVWFVNRRTIPWPPEPLRLAVSHALRGYLRLEDRFYERRITSEPDKGQPPTR